MMITAATAVAEFSIALRTTSIFAVVLPTPITVCGSCANAVTRPAFSGKRGAMTNAGSGSIAAAAPILKSVASATVVTGTGNPNDGQLSNPTYPVGRRSTHRDPKRLLGLAWFGQDG